MANARKELPRLYKEYGITGKAKPKPKEKKKKTWIRKIYRQTKKPVIWAQKALERFKEQRRKRITLPSGVRTPEQIKELREIMDLPPLKKRKE